MSVPYRKQLNFTFDGLTQAANSVERLRNFKLRLESSQFPGRREREDRRDAHEKTRTKCAPRSTTISIPRKMLGAVFDMVRDVNAAADAGEVRKGDVPVAAGSAAAVRRNLRGAER